MHHSHTTHRRSAWLSLLLGLALVLSSLLPAVPVLAQTGSVPTATPAAQALPAKAAAPTTVSAAPDAGLGGPPFIYFVPLPEDQIKTSYDTIQKNGSTYRATTFVTAGVNGTVITYDQWEDGYEANLASPAQASTLIFGDGNPANGDANAYCSASCAGDIINAGDVLVLAANQTLTIPRNPSQIKFDGKDKFSTNYPVAGGRAYWPTDAGPLMAEAGQFYATDDYGTNFVMPVGEDLSAYSYQVFERVAAFIMAGANQTKCTYRGSPLSPLNEGQSVRVPAVQTGDVLVCDKPVQVHLITGDTGSNYEVRAFEAFARNTWTNSYYDPVGTVNTGYPAVNYVYNPHATALTVRAETRFGTTSFSVPANGVTRYAKPDSAVHLFSSDGRDFYALNVNDAAQSDVTKNQTYDWGHPLIPESLLTTMMVSGWAPGSEDGTPPNGNPVWVTALGNTTLYIDYDADPLTGAHTDTNGNKYDATLALTRLQSARIYDTADNDQTGLRLYTLDGVKISGAWGEDGSRANVARPNIDAGTVALPFPVPSLNKSVSLAVDNNSNGQYDTGDTARYRIAVRNAGGQPLVNVRVEDTLPAGVAYVAGSTTLDGAPVADDAGAFPLLAANGGLALPNPTQAPGTVPAGAQYVIEFRVTIQPAAAGKVLTNTALLFSSAQSLQSSVDITVPPSTITQCTLSFTDGTGTNVSFVLENGALYVTVADADHNLNTAVQETLGVVVRNVTGGDEESLVLRETTASSGVFRNTAGLPVSTTAGAAPQDGTLNARVGQTLQADYTDALFGDTCNDTLLMAGPTQSKVLYLSEPGQALDRVDPVATGDNSTASSAVLGGSVTISTDATSSTQKTTGTGTVTLSHTTGTASNRLLLVGVSFQKNGVAGRQVNTVAYGSQSLTKVRDYEGSDGEDRAEIWKLVNPPNGTATITVTMGGPSTPESIVVGATTFSGVNQSTPLGTEAVAAAADVVSAGHPSVSVSSATGELVFDVVARDQDASLIVGAGQTQRWNVAAGTGLEATTGAASTEPGAASVTMSWTSGDTGQAWAMIAVPIKPAMAVNTATFTQTPAMASNFVMPVGGLITVTNYVSTTGTLPANPAITATLKSNGATFAMLTNPTATLVSGGTPSFYRLAWSAAMTSTTTVATGQAVSLTVTTSITQTFQVLYDSSAYPSQVKLPTNTVIKVDSLGIYSAPYPGGSLVTSTSPGQTLYIRAQVSDPFGAYDITGATLNISGTLVALTAGHVAASDAASKTYEYAWFVPAGTCKDTYPVSITANEGSEGITATAQTEILSICDDFGTQCAAHFLSALGGNIVTTYTAGATTFLRVVDFDQNLNPGAVENVTASVNSTTYTLTETGVNTGIFEGADGAIVAGQAAQLLYVDPNTLLPGADVCTAEAQTPVSGASAPGVYLLKWLAEPVVGPAVVGDVVRFQLEVFNTGNVILAPVVITDTFDNTRLQFTSANPAPTGSAAGSLTWNNLGPLTDGESKVIEVVFRAVGTAAPTVNNATVTATPPSGPVLTETASANVTIVGPALQLSKTTLTPANRQAQVGENVTFRIAITNSGSSVMDVLPLVDTFDAVCLAYVSASPAPTATGYGVLFWQDLTQTFGQNLGLGQQFTLSVTLRTLEVCDPAVNRAAVEFASDVNGNPPPPVSDDDFVQTSASYDFGDAPASYGTLLAANGARHALSLFRPLQMGAVAPDAEADGQPTTSANGDDLNGSDDEDGVTLPAFVAGQPATVVVTVTNSTGVTATLYGFIDFNGDGSFGPGETVTVTVPHNTDGPLALPFNVPANANPSQPVGARFRLSTADGLTAVGLAPDGEVEDYVVQIAAAASIGDYIWYDTNGDGVQNVGEFGLANVTVKLSGPSGEVTTATGANGDYLFAGLASGVYSVTVTDANGVLTGLTHTQGPQSLPSPTAAITLTAGERYRDADFGYMRNPGPGNALIGDFVWYDGDGDGLQDPGEPGIPGVAVCASPLLGGTGGGCATTDATGKYLIVVPAGTYSVTPTLAQAALTGLAATTPQPRTVTVAAGEQVLTADFGYRADTTLLGRIGDQVWDDTPTAGLGNGVRDLGEPGLANVSVDLIRDTNGNGHWDTGEPIITTVNTDPTGHYLFTGLPAGAYLVQVSDTWGVLRRFGPTVIVGGTADNTNKAQPYAVVLAAGAANLTADFGYSRGGPSGAGDPAGAIGDQVWNDLNHNGLFEPALGETGIAGVTVDLYAGFFLLDSQTTNGSGNYVFLGLPADVYTVQVTDAYGVLAGYQATVPGPNPGQDNNNQARPYTVTLGADTVDWTADFGYLRQLAPTGVGVYEFKAAIGRGQVTLNWLAVGLQPPSFYVRRADNSKGVGAAQVTAQPVTSGTGAYQFVDRGVVAGQTYWYTLEDANTGQTYGPLAVTVAPMSIRGFLPMVGQ